LTQSPLALSVAKQGIVCMHLFSAFIASLATFILVTLPAQADYPLAYVGSADARDMSMSPDGSSVAVLMTDFEFGIRQRRDWDVIEFKDAVSGDVTYRHDLEDRLYYWVFWPFEEVVLAQTLQYTFSRRKAKTQLVILAIDPVTKEERVLYEGPKGDYRKSRDIPKISGVSRARREIAMEVKGGRGTELRAIHVDTGKSRLLAQGNNSTIRWELGDDLEPVLRFDRGKRDSDERVFARDENGEWKLLRSYNVVDNNFSPASRISSDDTMLVLHRPESASRRGLYHYDFRSNTYREQAFEHETYDLVTARRASFGGDLMYVGWFDDKLQRKWFDDEYAAAGALLDKALKPEDNWSIQETSASNRQWLLYVSSPVRPGTYMHFDIDRKKLRIIAKDRPVLTSDKLSPMMRIDYQAADGKQLFGYLTRKTDNVMAPLIVMPHGGPVARDYADFDGYVQFLAAKGYQVFQPQFRGGGGLGRDFEAAGFGQWGKAMQTDIEDGVTALISQSYLGAEAYRSIMGFSYGGYAALAGATLTPDNYLCAISINGVSDLPTMLASYNQEDGLDRAAYDVWVKRIGDPYHQKAEIEAVSPLRQVAQTKAQVLLIHGMNDDIVDIQQSRMMYSALIEAGKYAVFHEVENAGHQFYDQDDRTNVLVNVDRFLTSCMPAPAPVSP
jgi:dipeptidyl aminopeptidase/acylaminoacyl peptidase